MLGPRAALFDSLGAELATTGVCTAETEAEREKSPLVEGGSRTSVFIGFKTVSGVVGSEDEGSEELSTLDISAPGLVCCA